MELIRKLWNKYGDVLPYLVFGVLTTVVNYVVYLPCVNVLHWAGWLSNMVAWAAAATFAYVTNKLFVFHSKSWAPAVVVPEALKFFGARLGSGLGETAIIFVTVDLLHWNGTWMKLLTSVLVVVFNYFASKLLIFRKDRDGSAK